MARATNNGVFIAPLVLLPFVENAFKHGVNRQLDDAWIQIQLTATPNELVFKVKNSKPKLPNDAPTPGLGLPNIEKRLQLIYPNRHQLRQLDGAGTYLVTLKPELTNQAIKPATQYKDSLFTS